MEEQWVFCPNCKSKTRVRVLKESILENFPLYCPKCKKEYLVNISEGKITSSQQLNIIQLDAKTQN